MIEVDQLTRYYGTNLALEDVTFSIDERAIVGFLGLNGAGKSTLMKILSGLLLPSAGRVTIDGVDAVEAPDSLRSRIGFLPEDPPLYEEMRVDDFLTWCGQIKGSSKSSVEERLPEVAEVCDIADMTDRLIRTLSHGYRKRVGIAQAIIHDPELVVLDEPISGLDPVQIVDMRDVLRRLREECTVLVSSHILSEISETCDRVLVLHEGRLVADGTEEELAEKIGGGIGLTFQLRGERDAIESVFSNSESTREFTHEGTVDGVVEYEVQLAPEDREALVADLVEAGVGVRGLDETETELEQAFLGVTGESDRTEQPGDVLGGRDEAPSDSDGSGETSSGDGTESPDELAEDESAGEADSEAEADDEPPEDSSEEPTDGAEEEPPSEREAADESDSDASESDDERDST